MRPPCYKREPCRGGKGCAKHQMQQKPSTGVLRSMFSTSNLRLDVTGGSHHQSFSIKDVLAKEGEMYHSFGNWSFVGNWRL